MIILPKAIQKLRNVLPKTGQIISYQAGDDGEYEAGWWRKRLNANNKTRFRTVVIGGATVYLDYATRLMWKEYGYTAETMTWADAITFANNLVYAGFSDWRLPNRLELLSIVNHGSTGLIYPDCPLTIMSEDTWTIYWTSTTDPTNTIFAYCLDVGAVYSSYPGQSYPAPKTYPFYVAVCREF